MEITEWTLKQLLEQIESCKFECEAGPLDNNVAYIELKRRVEKVWLTAVHQPTE